MSLTKAPEKFELLLAEPNDACRGMDRNFRKNRGDRLLSNLLISAGMTGVWKFHYIETVRATGHTPPITIKQHEQNGVRIKVKPGDNGSCIIGLLIVPKESGLSPLSAHQKLTAAIENTDHDLTEGVQQPVALLPPPPPKHTNGHTPHPVALPPPPTVDQSDAPAITADTVLEHQSEIERLATLPGELAKIRKARKDVAGQIVQLRARDDQLAAQERQLMGSFDLEALALLVDSMKKPSLNEADAR